MLLNVRSWKPGQPPRDVEAHNPIRVVALYARTCLFQVSHVSSSLVLQLFLQHAANAHPRGVLMIRGPPRSTRIPCDISVSPSVMQDATVSVKCCGGRSNAIDQMKDPVYP